MKNSVKTIDIQKVKSKWYADIFAEWQPPDPGYIDYLLTCLEKKQYIAPIVVVKEGETYYIVNGHHRYYACLKTGENTIKCIVIEGSFEESEPLRKAEVLLKEFDQKTGYRYKFSGYLDRWAAAEEEQGFVNKYRPTYKFRLYQRLKNRFKKNK